MTRKQYEDYCLICRDIHDARSRLTLAETALTSLLSEVEPDFWSADFQRLVAEIANDPSQGPVLATRLVVDINKYTQAVLDSRGSTTHLSLRVCRDYVESCRSKWSKEAR